MFIQSGDRGNWVNASQAAGACVDAFGSAIGVLVQAGQEYRMNATYEKALAYIDELEGNQSELIGHCDGLAARLLDSQADLERARASARQLRIDRFNANRRIAELEAQLASRQ